MKKRILFISLITIVQFTYAQGDLQFNQVLSYTGSVSCNTGNCGANSPSSYTVPAGKVWKLESAGYNSNKVSGYFSQAYLIINGTGAYGGIMNQGSEAAYSGKLISSPVWLKAGDVLSWGMNSNSGTGGTFSVSMHLSIIEFNIVP